MAGRAKSIPALVTDERRNEVVRRAAEQERRAFRITPSQRQVFTDDGGRREGK